MRNLIALMALLTATPTLAEMPGGNASPYTVEKRLQAELDYRLAGQRLDAADKTCAELRAAGLFQGSTEDCFERVRQTVRQCSVEAKARALEAALNARVSESFATVDVVEIESCAIQRSTAAISFASGE